MSHNGLLSQDEIGIVVYNEEKNFTTLEVNQSKYFIQST